VHLLPSEITLGQILPRKPFPLPEMIEKLPVHDMGTLTRHIRVGFIVVYRKCKNHSPYSSFRFVLLIIVGES